MKNDNHVEMYMQAFKWALLFPTFLICSYFPYFFIKMPYYPYFFHSKMSFTRKIPKKFSSFASLAQILYINFYVYSGGTPLNISNF